MSLPHCAEYVMVFFWSESILLGIYKMQVSEFLPVLVQTTENTASQNWIRITLPVEIIYHACIYVNIVSKYGKDSLKKAIKLLFLVYSSNIIEMSFKRVFFSTSCPA